MVEEGCWINARPDHVCRYPHCNAVRGNVRNHNSIRANHSVVSNDYGTENFCAGSDIHTASCRRHATLGRIAADGDALINVGIIAYWASLSMDDNAKASVAQDHSLANCCGMRKPAGKQNVDQIVHHSRDIWHMTVVEGMGYAMEPQGIQHNRRPAIYLGA